ncbi:glyoxalase [Bradyrhizobium sp. CCBAU 11386]|uniref:VOC family protein n=1 Tax=Bradyrhizobium sp. CCBAU 11386 TaxID=1630837 RepID=UPI00230365F0|nr:VOC family protein [Bradyrhizobium sp. CCBAU 11386]MDA9508597.1 glyoxalase [Bradyrhizobium sp. CCBAU 11386]
MTAIDNVECITLFVPDLDSAKAFYEAVFCGNFIYEDETSAVLKLRNLMINLLDERAAPELIRPRPVGGPGAPPRLPLTVLVDDVDACCVKLAERQVPILNGPIDRPWGRRTVAFLDPAGHAWELAHPL